MDQVLPLGLALWLLNPIPPIEYDLARFPSHAMAKKAYAFNQAYYCGLEARLQYQPGLWEDYDLALRYNRYAGECWSALESVTNPNASNGWRRRSLNILRELLSEEDWGLGQMPCPFPYWTLRY